MKEQELAFLVIHKHAASETRRRISLLDLYQQIAVTSHLEDSDKDALLTQLQMADLILANPTNCEQAAIQLARGVAAVIYEKCGYQIHPFLREAEQTVDAGVPA